MSQPTEEELAAQAAELLADTAEFDPYPGGAGSQTEADAP